MNFKYKLTAIAVVGLLNLAPAAVMAATLNTGAVDTGGGGVVAAPNDGVLQNFSGIDWHSNGAGYVQGFTLTGASAIGDTADLVFTYQAFAGGINSTTATPNLRIAPPGAAGASGYELTTVATIFETATCVNVGCSIITFAPTAGTTSDFKVFFDATPDADQAAGTGFFDGTEIISGTWDGQSGIFNAISGPVGSSGAGGTGTANLVGTITSTDNAFVNPDLLGSTFQSVLTFPGESPPNFTRPAFVTATDGTIIATGFDTPINFVVQADGSQTFTSGVPIPSSILLMGSALLGLSGFLKRKRA